MHGPMPWPEGKLQLARTSQDALRPMHADTSRPSLLALLHLFLFVKHSAPRFHTFLASLLLAK